MSFSARARPGPSGRSPAEAPPRAPGAPRDAPHPHSLTPVTPRAQTQRRRWRIVRNHSLYFWAGLYVRWGPGGSYWPCGASGPAPPAAPGHPRGGCPGAWGGPARAGSQAARPAAAFGRSPSAPGGALLPTNPFSEGFWGHPRSSCLPLCPPGLHPGLLTSPFCQPGPLGCSGSG